MHVQVATPLEPVSQAADQMGAHLRPARRGWAFGQDKLWQAPSALIAGAGLKLREPYAPQGLKLPFKLSWDVEAQKARTADAARVGTNNAAILHSRTLWHCARVTAGHTRTEAGASGQRSFERR